MKGVPAGCRLHRCSHALLYLQPQRQASMQSEEWQACGSGTPAAVFLGHPRHKRRVATSWCHTAAAMWQHCDMPGCTATVPRSYCMRGSCWVFHTYVISSHPLLATSPSTSVLKSRPTANSVWWSHTRSCASSGAEKSHSLTVMS